MNTLVAGFGNIFRSDDGLGPAVIRQLWHEGVGENVCLRDFGTGGMHLALEMLGEYDVVIIVDAVGRDEPPGTAFTIELDRAALDAIDANAAEAPADAHDMNVGAVVRLYRTLRAQGEIAHEPQIFVVGCVPKNTQDGMGLSEPVLAAVPVCADLVRRLAQQMHPLNGVNA